MKKEIQPNIYNDVKVICICGQNHIIASSTVSWPIKIESCKSCHPSYNPDKNIEVVIKWRRQKYLEKLEKIKNLKK